MVTQYNGWNQHQQNRMTFWVGDSQKIASKLGEGHLE